MAQQHIAGLVPARSRTKAREEEAAGWYREHGPPILRYLRYLVGDPALADDLLQETFAAAFAQRRQFRRQGSPRTWLRSIALNVVRRDARRQALRPAVEAAGQAQISAAEPTDGPARQNQWLERLDTALARLSIEEREAFVLRAIEELPLAQCAEILGSPVSTISRRATRAEAKVRAALEGESS